MSDMAMIPMNGAAPEPPPAPTMSPLTGATPEECVNALMFGVASLSRKSAQNPSAAEAKDYAQAALALAQTLVVMDPNSTADGVPLEHELELEMERQDGQARLEEARQAAAAPKTKRVDRTDSGGFQITEG